MRAPGAARAGLAALALALGVMPAAGQTAAGQPAQGQGQPAANTANGAAPALKPEAGKALGGGNGGVTIPSPVLTIDPDRLFTDSDYGKRVERDLEAQARALASQNRKIEDALKTEEKQLTEERPKMAPDAFRKLADAFDAKVQRIRKEQDDKNKALGTRREAERKKFLQLVLPILANLIREDGAVAILNRQAIFLSFSGIDVTDRAIARINAKIGDGAALDKNTPEGTAPGTNAPALNAPKPAAPAAPGAAGSGAAPSKPPPDAAPGTAPAAPATGN
ncbi:OmpH family outer membrane protein [Solirhodobacter olei]|uniref:OmpH family outer membrane protein n=1 Tax=Solirhodobacter olei TaxID=2493082 RepID=UPI000FDCA063|nr:OmpH family outer membrane protein [Solirhodobacter olei]